MTKANTRAHINVLPFSIPNDVRHFKSKIIALSVWRTALAVLCQQIIINESKYNARCSLKIYNVLLPGNTFSYYARSVSCDFQRELHPTMTLTSAKCCGEKLVGQRWCTSHAVKYWLLITECTITFRVLNRDDARTMRREECKEHSHSVQDLGIQHNSTVECFNTASNMITKVVK
jgi:hypothetical protein